MRDLLNRIMVLVAVNVCLILSYDNALAQVPEESSSVGDNQLADTPLVLDTVTVTGARTETEISEVATSVSVAEEEAIAEQLTISTNIGKTLDVLVPGLTVSQEEFRSGCSTNIRGRPAQFLINGVPTNDNLRRSSCRGLYNVNPFALERIEVQRGATALFGAGAPGGAINLITRRAQSQALEIDLAAQSSINPHATSGSLEYNLYAGAGQAFSAWDYYAGIGYQDYGARRNPEDGFVPGSEFKSGSLVTSLGWDVGSAGRLRFTGLYFREDPGTVYASDFTAVSGERFADNIFVVRPPNPRADQAQVEQILLILSYDVPSVLGHALHLSLFMHDEELIQRSADFFAGDVFYFNSDAENQRQGFRSTASRTFGIGEGSIEAIYGVDLLRQRYYRPQLDDETASDVVGFVSPEVTLDSLALFVQPKVRAGRWLFTGGVRYETFRGEVGSEGFDPSLPGVAAPGDVPDFDLTLFNLGAVYDLTDRLQLYGGFSQGAEISEFGRAARGTADPSLINLNAAASNQYELGIRGGAGRVDFSTALFYSQSDEAASLTFDPSCAGEPFCPLIPLRLDQEIYGAEATADWWLSDRTVLGAILTYQRGEFTEEGATPVDFGSDTLSPPRATLYIAFEPIAKWRNRIQGTYFAETDYYSAAQEAAGFRDSEALFLMDLTSSYPLGPGMLSLGISNLLNRKYVNVTNQASGDFFYYLSEGMRATLTYQVRL